MDLSSLFNLKVLVQFCNSLGNIFSIILSITQYQQKITGIKYYF